MPTCVQTQFKGSSRGIEQQLKQHEVQRKGSNKLSNINVRLKKSVFFFFN